MSAALLSGLFSDLVFATRRLFHCLVLLIWSLTPEERELSPFGVHEPLTMWLPLDSRLRILIALYLHPAEHVFQIDVYWSNDLKCIKTAEMHLLAPWLLDLDFQPHPVWSSFPSWTDMEECGLCIVVASLWSFVHVNAFLAAWPM